MPDPSPTLVKNKVYYIHWPDISGLWIFSSNDTAVFPVPKESLKSVLGWCDEIIAASVLAGNMAHTARV